MKISKPLVFIACLLLFIIALSVYTENGKEGFIVEAVGTMVKKRINKRYRPFRKNLMKHKKNLTEDFTKMVQGMTKN
jgi:hypothetical protein